MRRHAGEAMPFSDAQGMMAVMRRAGARQVAIVPVGDFSDAEDSAQSGEWKGAL